MVWRLETAKQAASFNEQKQTCYVDMAAVIDLHSKSASAHRSWLLALLFQASK